MNILIAGGAGFVGASLAIHLKAQYPHYQVTALDNLSRKGSSLNLPRLQEAGVVFRQGDTRFPEQLVTTTAIDFIIDAAAEPSVLAGLDEGLDYLVHTNFNGTVHLLNLARQHKAGFLFLSTSRVYPYGMMQQLPLQAGATRFEWQPGAAWPGISAAGVAENAPLTGPRSLYGATKLSSELMVTEYAAAFGLPALVNRFGVIAGPWQMGKADQGVTALWMARHYWQQPLQYIGFGGKGLQVRDLLHIHDLCRLINYELHHFDALAGNTFNAGGGAGCSVSLQELTRACAAITGNRVPIACELENRPGDIPWYLTDNSAINAATGWQPQKSVGDILRDTFEWIRDHALILKPVLG